MKLLLSFLLCLLPAFSYAQELPHWKVTPEKSSLLFIAKNNGAEVEGKFTKFDTQIAFDPAQLQKSSVKTIVQVGSIDADYEAIPDTLKTETWFDVANYPIATFESTNFRHIKDKEYEADGNFTLRGETKPLTLHFTLEEYTPKSARIKGKAVISRLAHGVGQGEWQGTSVVADKVDLLITLEATPTK